MTPNDAINGLAEQFGKTLPVHGGGDVARVLPAFFDWLLLELLDLTKRWPAHRDLIRTNCDTIKAHAYNFDLVDVFLANLATILSGRTALPPLPEATRAVYYRQMVVKLMKLTPMRFYPGAKLKRVPYR